MHKEKYKILLAEDDHNLGILLTDLLEAEGYDVTLCKDGEQALKLFYTNPFHVCLLDVMMPKVDGFSIAKEIRIKNKEIPIVFITAKSMKEDKLIGYNLGADDFVTKPFDEEELIWKIKAITRRIPEKANDIKQDIIWIGKYKFDCYNQLLTFENTNKRITEKECDILKFLFQHRNSIVKREDVLKALWGENDYFLGRSLDVFITKIRKYLKEDNTISIENVFGVGFIFNVPDNQI